MLHLVSQSLVYPSPPALSSSPLHGDLCLAGLAGKVFTHTPSMDFILNEYLTTIITPNTGVVKKISKALAHLLSYFLLAIRI